VAKPVVPLLVWLALSGSTEAFGQSAESLERTGIAGGLTASGCEAHPRLNSACHFELTGPVTRVQAQSFEAFLARRTRLHGFAFDITSTGGSADAAMTIGMRLRERGATVIARGDCDTACVLVLAGGAHRSTQYARVTIGRPYPDNVHELGEDRAERYVERITNPIASYLDRMGISGSLLAAMLAVPARETRTPGVAELREYGLAGTATMPP